MPKYLSGSAIYFGAICPATATEPAYKIPLSAIRNLNLAQQYIPICVNHDQRFRLGATPVHATTWMDSSWLKYEVEIQNDEIGKIFLDQYSRGLFQGSSASTHGVGSWETDRRNGQRYQVTDEIVFFKDLGPVGTPRNGGCFGLELRDKPVRYKSRVSLAGILPVSASVKRPKRIISLPAMPSGIKNGQLIASAGAAGQGVTVKGIRFSAAAVQSMIQNRLTAVR